MCCMQNDNNRVMEKVATAFSALRGRLTCVALVALAAAWLPQNSGGATSLYWDANGVAAGASSPGTTGTGTWGTDNFWSTTSAGVDPGAWTSGNIAIFSAGADATGTFTVTLNGTQTAGGVTFEEGTVTLAGGQLTLSGPIAVNAFPTKAIISSVIGGSAGLTKLNTGELVLQAANIFTGNLTNRAGILTLNFGSAASSGVISLNPSSPVTLRSTQPTLTLPNDIVLDGSSSTIDIVAESGNTLTLNGVISGGHSWSASGLGTLVLDGASPNTFTSPLTVQQGTVIVTKDGALGSTLNGTLVNNGATLGFDGSITYNTAETITLNGNGVSSLGALRNVTGINTFEGTVALASDSSIGVAVNDTLILGGPVVGAKLTKVGLGTVELIGAPNNYGETVVSQGTLAVTYPANAGTNLVTVNAGATLLGNGSAPGGVNLSGTIWPYAPDAFDSGPQTWNGGATYVWEVANAATPLQGSLGITGNLSINATSGNKFTIQVESLDPNTFFPGNAGSFNNTLEYNWTIATTTTGILNFDPAKFTINPSGFSNPLNGGSFVILTSGNNLVLRFDPAPVITCPANITQGNDLGQCSASVSFAASATDNQPGVTFQYKIGPTVITSPHVFNVGPATTVTATATDSVGNTATCNFTVTVNDTQPPVPVCQNITRSFTGTPITITAGDVYQSGTDNCGTVNLVSVVPDTFGCAQIGVNNVTLTVNDGHGNTAICQSQVTITDDRVTPPPIVYVDDNYAGKPTCEQVNFPDNGATGPYVIGYNAFATIQAGVTAVAPGGTVNVAAGRYPEVVLVNKPVTILGAQAGQNANTRFAAFTTGVNGPKADPSVESIITAAADDPANAANDSLHIMADNVTIDGFVVDGNNPVLPQGGAVLVGGIKTDSRRAIETEDASGNLFSANSASIKNNIIQNFAQRGVELANPTDTSPATSGSLITGNVIRNFGWDGILIAFNAYSDVTSNTVDMAAGGEAGIWLQDFPSSGATPKTLDWSHNTVTVCQDAIGGIWANLFYASAATINIHDNTVNAATGVTGTDDFTFGIYLSTLQGGTTAHLTDNIVGASGGQFARGIALWNLPTTATTTVTGGTVGNALKGVSLHDSDPNFGLAGASCAVDLSGVSISGTTVGIFVDATGSTGDTVFMQISGNTAVHTCTTGISVLGNNASANIHDNSASITGNAVGIDISGGKALIQNNTLTGNTAAAIRVENGATVDAGACSVANYTGLGTSAGGNNLSGYGFDNLAPWAVEDLNTSAQPNVLAQKNNYGIASGQNIEDVLYDDSDTAGANSQVLASQDNTLLVTCPPSPASVQCFSGIQAAATDMAGFLALLGTASSTPITVSHSDAGPVPGPNDGTVTRTYTITDGCGNSATCAQTIPIDDTTPPSMVCQPVTKTLTGAQVTVAPGEVFVSGTDNCGGTVTPVSLTPNTFACGGTYTVVLTATDGNGNSGICTTTVTVNDTRPAPAIVYVDDDYVGLVNGTSVLWPAGVGPTTALIGCDAFAKIQDGVNRVSPGGTVNVAAGNYLENVQINGKALTLKGANAGVDPRTTCRSGPARGPESVIDGGGLDATVAITFGTAHVTVDGFTIRNSGWHNNYNGGVYTTGDVVDVHVINNIITANTIGVGMGCAGPSSIRTNLITANNVPSGPSQGCGICLPYGSTSLTIADNEFTGHTLNSPINVQYSAHVGLAITRNNFHDNANAEAIYALGISAGTITQNQITAPGWTCLSLSGDNADVDVANNFFSNADQGVRVENPYGIQYSVPENSNVRIHGNSFAGFTFAAGTKYAVGNESSGYAAPLDASGNWWGNNTEAGVTGVIDTTGGLVDYTPWLDTGVESVAQVCDGFQGDYSLLHVSATSPQAGTPGPIQEAINLTADGALAGGNRVVSVLAGTYKEDLTVDRPLKLLGPNVGVSGCATRGSEAALVPATQDLDFGIVVQVAADNVTIDGFEINGDNPALTGGRTVGTADVNTSTGIQNGPFIDPDDVVGQYQIQHLTVQNNVFKNFTWDGLFIGEEYGLHDGYIVVRQNKFTNLPEGAQFYAVQADFSDNCGENITRLVSMHQVATAGDPGFTPRIFQNTMQVSTDTSVWNARGPGFGLPGRDVGIWINGRQVSAPALTVSGNVITVPGTLPSGATFWGMSAWQVNDDRVLLLQNNTVNGNGQAAVGLWAWGLKSSVPTVITGGALNNINGVGVLAANRHSFWGDDNTAITVDGVPITMAAGGVGVEAYDDPAAASGFKSLVIVQGNTAISGGATGVLVQGADASAKVINNPASITGNMVGVDVNGGKAMLQNNNLAGNSVAGIIAENGATVDAGQCPTGGSDVTGLGISTGGNILTGYLFDSQPAWAIENLNSSGPVVLAYNNNFGAGPGDDISTLLVQTSPVLFSQAGPLLVACPGPVTVQCAGQVPAAATDLPGFLAQGGLASFSPASVSAGDTVTSVGPGPNNRDITRLYTLTDACGNSSSCTQIITVRDTQPPTFAVGGGVSWWRAEGNANDSIDGHNGIISPTGVTFVPGHAGQAFSFDGATGYVDFGNWFNLQSFSISLWVNPGASQQQFADIVDNNHTGTQNWVIQQNGNLLNQYYFYDSQTFTYFSLPAGTWSHLVVTRTVGNLNTIYVNGVQVASTPSGPINYVLEDFHAATWGGGGRNWNGLEDEIMVFNRDLTATEVQSLYGGVGCPANIVVDNDPSVCGAVVNYVAPVGTDNCGSATTIQTAGLASGATFPLGTTVNTFQTTDASGNTATCSFTVTVNLNVGPAPAIVYVDDDYTGLPLGTTVLWPAVGGSGPHYIGCDAFATIQGGIDRVAAGGTVNVAAGTYVEDLIINAKGNLNVVGAPGATIQEVATYPAAGGVNNILIWASDGTKIHGFIIKSPAPVTGHNSPGIVINSQNVEISTNTFQVANSDDYNWLSVAIQTSSTNDNQLLLPPYLSPLPVDVSGLNIHDNTFTSLGSGTVGYDTIYINPDLGAGTVTIANNQFSGYVFRGISTERGHVTISGNSLTTTSVVPGLPTYPVGISFYNFNLAPIDTVILSCNSIQGFSRGITMGNAAGTMSLTGISVTQNIVQQNGTGIQVRSSANGVVVYNNSINGNTIGAQNTDAVHILNASGNWWGANAGVAGLVSANVDYTPWLNSGVNDGTPPCFQGDFSTLLVSAASPQVGNLGPIQEGINLIADGALTGCDRVLNVLPGLYIENVVIDRAVQVLGSNVGVPATGARGAEAVVKSAINDPDGVIPIIAVEHSCVRIDGFTIDGASGLGGGTLVGAVSVNGGVGIQNGYYTDVNPTTHDLVEADHLTIDNNIFKNHTYGGIFLWELYGVNHSWNYIRNNSFDNMWEGLQLYAMHADVSQNTFTSVNRGLSMHQVSVAADAGFVPQIVNNNITIAWNNLADTRDSGLWVNGRHDTAPALAVSGNTVNVLASMGTQTFRGLFISDVTDACTVSLVNNVVNGNGFANIGLQAWDITSTSPVILTGGSLNNIQSIGVLAENDDPDWGVANTALTIDNVPITMTGGVGVEAFADPAAPANWVKVIVQNGTVISGTATTSILVDGVMASAKVINSTASPAGVAVGVDVNAGKVLLQGNNVVGHTTAGIIARNGATVDAGQCPTGGTDVTGFGISTGGNVLTGYGFDNAVPWAIENQNASGPAVLAYNNNFGAVAGDDISKLLVQTSPVLYSQSGGVLLVQCPPGASYQCAGDVLTKATTMAGFIAQGGMVSSDPATASLTVLETVTPVGAGSNNRDITRQYTVTDACGNSNSCTQTITVRDTTQPTITCPPPVTVNNEPNQCYALATSVTLGTPTTGDNCGVASVVNDAPPLQYPVGVTIVKWTVTDTSGNTATCNQTVTVTDNQAPVIGAITATEVQPNVVGPVNVIVTDCTGTKTVQGTVNISVVASDNCPITPTISLLNGANMATATFAGGTGTVGDPFRYTWVVTPTTATGLWTATVTAQDSTPNITTTTFKMCVDNSQVTGQVQLEGFVGTGTVPPNTRTVVFVATDTAPPGAGIVLQTWTLPLTFTGDTASYTLTGVPASTLGLSAKTAWNLRTKLPVTLVGGQATGVNFTGAKLLRGGDFTGDNQVNFSDYSILGNNWFTTHAVADITGDGQVNLDDYTILSGNWFTNGDPQ